MLASRQPALVLPLLSLSLPVLNARPWSSRAAPLACFLPPPCTHISSKGRGTPREWPRQRSDAAALRVSGMLSASRAPGPLLVSTPRGRGGVGMGRVLCSAAQVQPEGEGYAFLDCGNSRRLESFGGVLVARPCPAAKWRPGLSQAEWDAALVLYASSALGGPAGSGKGTWRGKEHIPKDWRASFPSVGVTLTLSPSELGQVGVFPEQLSNWQFVHGALAQWLGGRGEGGVAKVLNGFAYTGGATLAAASAAPGSVEVVHLDGSKPAVTWARRNSEASSLEGVANLRWLIEDVMTYVNREIKRGSKYEGLIFDPPAFGRGGAKNREWNLSTDLPLLVKRLPALLSDDPSFVLLSCHDQDWPHERLGALLAASMPGGRTTSGVLGLTAEGGGKSLPNGVYARWTPS